MGLFPLVSFTKSDVIYKLEYYYMGYFQIFKPFEQKE